MEWRSVRRPTVVPAGFIEPCNPTVCKTAPSGPQWVHEIKHDGYRLIVRKDANRVRVFTRRGFDWTDKYPAIRIALQLLRVRSATIDGEAVCCGEEINGEDLRAEPLEVRKSKLERLLAHSSSGLRFVEHMSGDGQIVFRHACKLKLEGIVSKRKDLGYRSGPSKSWLKTKNPKAPAAMRVIEEGTW
jgi:bifunctional non-homologous end joining protein LigD